MLIDRFDDLNKRYIIQAILNKNELWNEYLDYRENHSMCKQTLFCKCKSEIEDFI
jgi:hypothetical protein